MCKIEGLSFVLDKWGPTSKGHEKILFLGNEVKLEK